MNAAAWFHTKSRRIVLIDKQGVCWRIVAEGPATSRDPHPVFELKPAGPQVIELGLLNKKRLLRLVPAQETPERPDWIEITAQQVAQLVLGLKPKKGNLFALAKGAGRVVLEIGSLVSQFNKALAYMTSK